MSKAMILTTGLSTNINNKVFKNLSVASTRLPQKRGRKKGKKILIKLYGYMLVATV